MLTTLSKKIFAIVLITMITAWYGCECVVKPPCNGTFNFRLQDKVTGQDLIAGPKARYSLDSLKIIAGSGNDSSVPSPVEKGSGDLMCYINGSSDTLFLTLNANDKDTLLLSFGHHKKTLCCQSGSRSVNGIVYNGTPAGSEGTIFLLEK